MPRRPALDRFLEKFSVVESGCWEWQASLMNGYGQFRESPERMTYAHRFAYEHYVGPMAKASTSTTSAGTGSAATRRTWRQ